MRQRNTIQRALVLEAVKGSECHPTAEEVYIAVTSKYPHIGRATVYRNLNQLAESGELRKAEMPGGADRYDRECRDHYHARCFYCGRVFDAELPYMAELEKAVKGPDGFTFIGHDIVFKGICEACKKAGRGGE